MNEYERQRLENIRRNQEKLKELNLLSASSIFKDLTTKTKKSRKKYEKKKYIKELKSSSKRITRNQAKILHINVDDKKEVEKYDEDKENIFEEDDKLVPAEEYFSEEIRKKAIIVDGHFNGWINPELMEKYHFEKSAKEAWDKNGGGKYSHKNPLGEFKEVTKSAKPRNWSSAKFIASKLFQKNPNAYFYRHLEPGLTQNLGDWDEEEKNLFLKIARKFGCGDKWGIFSSYIPKRVGYQCANYYRQVIIQDGLIFDPNYKFSKWGKPIYCGVFNNNNKKKKIETNNDKNVSKSSKINNIKESNTKNINQLNEQTSTSTIVNENESIINNEKSITDEILTDNKNNINSKTTKDKIETNIVNEKNSTISRKRSRSIDNELIIKSKRLKSNTNKHIARGRPKKSIISISENKPVSRGRPKKSEININEIKPTRGRPKKSEINNNENKPTTRGRPKKSDINTSENKPANRGRPKKSEINISENKPTRGRPKKSEININENKSTTRGRPKKSEINTNENKPATRGRPKKIETNINNNKSITRGRPKKIETNINSKPVTRGRPKKLETNINENKRNTRGRPKKSKITTNTNNSITKEKTKINDNNSELEIIKIIRMNNKISKKRKSNSQIQPKHMLLRNESPTGYSLRKREKISYNV